MISSSVIAAVVSVLCIAAVVTDALPCSVSFPNAASPSSVKATFDLSPLRTTSPNGWYSEDDKDLAGEHIDYYYWYNFCDNLGVQPTTTPPYLCNITTQAVGIAYQISNDTKASPPVDTACRVLGYAQNVSYALYDDTNPGLGVRVHYGNGAMCGGNNERDIWITVFCKRSGQEPILGQVSEDNACDYELEVHSLAGCPLECPIINEQLCNGHGVCGPDGDSNAARCFCNSGYGGDGCTDKVSDSAGSSHATSVLVAFVIILVIALLIMAVILYRKIKRLNADDSRYGQLQDNAPPRAIASGAVSAHSSLPSDSKAEADRGAASTLAAAVSNNV